MKIYALLGELYQACLDNVLGGAPKLNISGVQCTMYTTHCKYVFMTRALNYCSAWLGAPKLTNNRFTLQIPFHDQGLQLMFKAFKMQDNNNIVIKWEDPLLLIYETKN